MSAAITPFPQYAFMAWCSIKKSTGTILSLPLGGCSAGCKAEEVSTVLPHRM